MKKNKKEQERASKKGKVHICYTKNIFAVKFLAFYDMQFISFFLKTASKRARRREVDAPERIGQKIPILKRAAVNVFKTNDAGGVYQKQAVPFGVEFAAVTAEGFHCLPILVGEQFHLEIAARLHKAAIQIGRGERGAIFFGRVGAKSDNVPTVASEAVGVLGELFQRHHAHWATNAEIHGKNKRRFFIQLRKPNRVSVESL
jgi:hypothetical protein